MYISWRAARNLFQSQIQCQGERAIIRDKLKRPRFRRSLQCSQSAIPPAHGAACLGSATADLRELHLQQGLSGAGYGHRPSHNAWPLRACKTREPYAACSRNSMQRLTRPFRLCVAGVGTRHCACHGAARPQRICSGCTCECHASTWRVDAVTASGFK